MKESVIYQIYPKSFNDSDNSGMGDLKGITQRLDYLKDLGVDYLWITPFFTSHQFDNGYDVDNYYEIDERFGTMEDLEELIEKARHRNISIMLDMVFNHTSIFHEWFQKALAGDPEYMDFYYFRDQPTNWASKFGGSAWEYVESLDKYYLHLYAKEQADLNWHNPKVREKLYDILRFWMKKGIRGFRFDVINVIGKPDGSFENDRDGDGRRFYTDTPFVKQYIKEMVDQTGLKDYLTVGEMSSTTIENCIDYTNPDRCGLSMAFNFHHLKVDYKNGDKWQLMKPDLKQFKKIIVDWQIGMQEHGGWSAWFLNNHDQPRSISRFGDDTEKSGKMLATLIHTLRGTPYIFQGEEIGMTNADFKTIEDFNDVESLNYYRILEKEMPKEKAFEIIKERSRDNARTPMQWDFLDYAGFSQQKPWLKVNENYREINAKRALNNSASIFYYYRDLIRLRKTNECISRGFFKVLDSPEELFVYERYTESESILIILNLSDKEVVYEIPRSYYDNRIILSNCSYTGVVEPYDAMIIGD